jgi:hypothetical protein
MKINFNCLSFVLALSLMLPGYSIFAEEQVYGWELMTQQERNEHRTKMQNLHTEEEREQYRIEHHKQMQERAKQQGVTLPEAPQYRNKNMTPGMTPGSGMGGGKGR